MTDRPATGTEPPGGRGRPFTSRQLARLDEALTLASRECGITFSLYVGELEAPARDVAERLHAMLPDPAGSALIAISPGQRILEIVTGWRSAKRLPDRACALAALSMTAAFAGGDLIGGMVSGLRMLSDQAGHVN